MDLLEKTLERIKAPLVLDVATGSGSFAGNLRTEYQGIGTIIGIDVSLKGLEKSREILDRIDDMLTVCMDSSEMAFPEGSFDMVCISNSLHHMAGLDNTLKEMMRVLRTGGYFLVREMYNDNQTETQMTHVLMHEWWASIDTLRGVPHFSTFPRKKILHLCAALGLEELISSDYSFLDSDPMDKEVIDHVNGAIDTYIGRTEDLDNSSELVKRGEELRERLHNVGFHSATSLAVLGKKP
jgi:SAM-dependent methyltransferase